MHKSFFSGGLGLVKVLLMNTIQLDFLLLMLVQKSLDSTWWLEFHRTVGLGL